MKKNILLQVLALLVVASFVLSACGGGATEAPAAEGAATEAPAAAEGAATEAPAAGDIVASFKFNNSGTVDFCQLYVSPTSKNEWGPEQLQGNKLPAGGEFTLTNIPAGQYDIKVIGCDGTTENVISDVSITNQ